MRSIVITTSLRIGDEPELESGRGVDAPLTLRDRLGDALLSRLYEMCEIVRLEGKDYRALVRPHFRPA
jgi:hypothetical protein